MRIRKFEAMNYTEALSMIRRELGEDAIIMSSTDNGRRVEVTAAIDEGPSVSSAQARHAQGAMSVNLAVADGPARAYGARAPKPAPKPDPSAVFKKTAPVRPVAPAPAAMDSVTRELAELREAVMSMHRMGFEMSLPAGKRELFGMLRGNAVSEDLAVELCERASDKAEVHALIEGGIRTFGDSKSKAVMVIGPTGVGKTTTIAKLAARAIRQKKRVALINLDTYRIGAVEQIRIYARILGIPLETAHDIDGLAHALELHADKDMVFIDTTGRNPRDPKYIEELNRIATMGLPIEIHLLMSASSDEEFLTESAHRYGALPIDALGITKADEACRFGAIYNLSAITGRPVAYLTTGQKVPDDIEFPDAAALAGMVLGTAASCGVA